MSAKVPSARRFAYSFVPADEYIVVRRAPLDWLGRFDGDLAFLDGDLAFFEGDFAFFDGDLAFLEGDLAFFDGALAFLDGDLAFFDGDLAFFDGAFLGDLGFLALRRRPPVSSSGSCANGPSNAPPCNAAASYSSAGADP